MSRKASHPCSTAAGASAAASRLASIAGLPPSIPAPHCALPPPVTHAMPKASSASTAPVPTVMVRPHAVSCFCRRSMAAGLPSSCTPLRMRSSCTCQGEEGWRAVGRDVGRGGGDRGYCPSCRRAPQAPGSQRPTLPTPGSLALQCCQQPGRASVMPADPLTHASGSLSMFSLPGREEGQGGYKARL